MSMFHKKGSAAGAVPRQLDDTPIEMQVRKAQMNDAGAVALILRELGWWESISREPYDATVARVMGHIRLCNADRSHTIYVAEYQGEVLGYAAVHWLPYLFLSGPEGYVSELFVLVKGRGKGIGTRLLQEIRAEARERGCSRLRLLNSRRRDSYRRGYYRKLGWEERREMADFVLKIE